MINYKYLSVATLWNADDTVRERFTVLYGRFKSQGACWEPHSPGGRIEVHKVFPLPFVMNEAGVKEHLKNKDLDVWKYIEELKKNPIKNDKRD